MVPCRSMDYELPFSWENEAAMSAVSLLIDQQWVMLKSQDAGSQLATRFQMLAPTLINFVTLGNLLNLCSSQNGGGHSHYLKELLYGLNQLTSNAH